MKRASTFLKSGGHRLLLPVVKSSILVIACGVLAACSSRSAGIYETAKSILESPPDVDKTELNPAIRYLRVVTNGSVALLALGYVDSDANGRIDVWYSSAGEVLRLQNGYVVGLTGSTDEWRQVRLSGAPAWPSGAATTTFTRTRDTMPGYRFNIVDQMTLRQTQPPAKSNLQTLKPEELRWYEAVDRDGRLPLTRIALAPATPASGGNAAAPSIATTAAAPFTRPVYGEQCISSGLCLTWQQWPPTRTR